jgi:hypothetical protein
VGVEADPDAAAPLAGAGAGGAVDADDQPDPAAARPGAAAAAETAEGVVSPVRAAGADALWQVDIVGGVWLVNPATGELREAKIVTGVDDHSRFCVMAKVVERATARAVCVTFAEALARFGVPEEVQSDNGKQTTASSSPTGSVRAGR